MSHSVGIKVTAISEDNRYFTSAPAYITAHSATHMIDLSKAIAQALMLLENAGVIDSYSVVLKCEVDQATPGAGP